MRDALLALAVVIAVTLGVSVEAQAGPPMDTEVVLLEAEITHLVLDILLEPEAADHQHLVWDWESQRCYVQGGYAPQPPPRNVARRRPIDYRFADFRPRRPTERLADGRLRFRGDWPRGQLIAV